MTLSARVTVLQDGRYLGPDRKAVEAVAGDVVTVLGGWYVAALVEDGLAGYAPEFEVPEAIIDPAMPVQVHLAAMARPRKPTSARLSSPTSASSVEPARGSRT